MSWLAGNGPWCLMPACGSGREGRLMCFYSLTPALSRRERECCFVFLFPRPSPLPEGEGVLFCVFIPSPRPSPGGRGSDVLCFIPSPQPSPGGRGSVVLCFYSLAPALSRRERGCCFGKVLTHGLDPSPGSGVAGGFRCAGRVRLGWGGTRGCRGRGVRI